MKYGTVTPGSIVRHFKGNFYEIVDFAEHTETGELLVIYRQLKEPKKVYARPADMFFSKVDKSKYPEATQELRFQLIMKGEDLCSLEQRFSKN